MDEADTIERVKSRRVQVASLPPADSGRGFARLPDKLMDDLGLNEGDVIESERLIRRLTSIVRLFIPKLSVLETMLPSDFIQFRDRLRPASGSSHGPAASAATSATATDRRLWNRSAARWAAPGSRKCRFNGRRG